MCLLHGDKTDQALRDGDECLDLPNVPGEVFASAKDHATLAIPPALEGLCRGRAVAFCNAGGGRWRGREDGWVVRRDEGHVGRGRVWRRGV